MINLSQKIAHLVYIAVKSVYTIVLDQTRIIKKHSLGKWGAMIFLFFVILALLGPYFTQYDKWSPSYHKNELEKLKPPSLRHPMGTTQLAKDVFSRYIYATRTTLVIGLIAGFISILVGGNIGLFAGYFGGWVDTILMRATDVVYGVPFLPFIIVLIALLGRSIEFVIIAIIMVVWRTSARVVRAEVLSLRRQQFVKVAKARGSSDLRIIFRHIVPNILPLLLLYTAFNIAWSILAETGASFLGFGDPNIFSWGGMLYQLWVSGTFREAWWWFIPPGFSIVALVVSFIFISQAYEEVANPRLKG